VIREPPDRTGTTREPTFTELRAHGAGCAADLPVSRRISIARVLNCLRVSLGDAAGNGETQITMRIDEPNVRADAPQFPETRRISVTVVLNGGDVSLRASTSEGQAQAAVLIFDRDEAEVVRRANTPEA
jgi:hypothetical protein